MGPGGNFKCYTCQQFFSHYRSLKRHIEDQHRRPRRFTCEECGKTYGRADNLRAHERKHQGPRERSPRRRSSEGSPGKKVRERSPQTRHSRQTSPRSSRSGYQPEERARSTSKKTSRERSVPPKNPPGRSHSSHGRQGRSPSRGTDREDSNRKTSTLSRKVRSPSRASRGSEKGESDLGDQLVVDVSPTTRQSVEGERRTPLQGKARGMWALLASESRPADSTSEDAEESEGTIGREESDVPARDACR